MDHSDEDTNGTFEFVDKSDVPMEEKSLQGISELGSSSDSKWEDVLGSGHLLKKVIKKGNDDRPIRHDVCKIKYECYHEEKLVEKVDELKISVSDSELIQGLDIIITLMNVGEIAEVKVGPRFAYGPKGIKDENLDIPPDATLCYKLELLSKESEPEFETLSVEDRAAIGLKKKDRGNWWFRREEYQSAVICYKRALQYLDYNEEENLDNSVLKTDADSLIEERVNVYNNLSAAQLKLDNVDDALFSADVVLKLQPNNLKALYRKGKALIVKGDRAEALKCFKKALDIDPENKTARSEYQRLQNLLAADAKSERKFYKKMFQPSKSDFDSNRASIKKTWIKLAVFIGSLAIAVVGVIVYRLSLVEY